MSWQNVTPKLLLELMQTNQVEAGQIIDVREQFEWDYYHLEESALIPMNTIPIRMQELDDTRPIYIVCAHGVRSVAVCNYLEEQGYSNLHNVTGGMAAIALIKGFQYD